MAASTKNLTFAGRTARAGFSASSACACPSWSCSARGSGSAAWSPSPLNLKAAITSAQRTAIAPSAIRTPRRVQPRVALLHARPCGARRPARAAPRRRAEARVVLVDVELPVEPEPVRVGAQEALDVRLRREDVERLLLERAQVARPDLGRLLDVGELELLAVTGLAQAVSDLEHGRPSILGQIRGSSGAARKPPAQRPPRSRRRGRERRAASPRARFRVLRARPSVRSRLRRARRASQRATRPSTAEPQVAAVASTRVTRAQLTGRGEGRDRQHQAEQRAGRPTPGPRRCGLGRYCFL